jgi:eukaryotic-like serine/threonine-protein kinase
MPEEEPPRRGVPRPLSGGPIQFGPYMLEARLAVGGTSEVYVARPIDPTAVPRRLIVKRLLPHFVADPEGRPMFEREAALHQSVVHENIVRVYGYGFSQDGEPYLAIEYVEGVDLYRLLRRQVHNGQLLPLHVAIHLTRELLRALESVHGARDATGAPLGIVHRDVTPSNVYLSNDGGVKLGDFGIARSSSRSTMRNAASAMLKGKFAYLSPEQVAGEPFDYRADLFSVAAVLAEMILGKPLFSGSGQLAVLLAIRDCRIDPLREARVRLPPGLFEVLEAALSREPKQRFQSAALLGQALRAFDRESGVARSELATLVRWVQTVPSVEGMAAVRESSKKLRAAAPVSQEPPAQTENADEFSRKTGEYSQLPSFVETAANVRFGPWTFARLVEALATGQVARGDKVDYTGRGLAPIEEIEELSRFLPARTNVTGKVEGLGSPDFVDDVTPSSILRVLMRVLDRGEPAVLFVEGQGPLDPRDSGGRKELYFLEGRLHHVATNNAVELLGEYLVRRKVISRDELDFALAVLPRYGGRMGDTLIALGLVNGVEMFRAIREQGRDRLVDLFAWNRGKLQLYFGQTQPVVEFPLELELAPLMMAGLEAAQPNDAPMHAFRGQLDAMIGPASTSTSRPRLRAMNWPVLVTKVLEAAAEPKPLRELLARVTHGGATTANDALRALQILLAANIVAWL